MRPPSVRLSQSICNQCRHHTYQKGSRVWQRSVQIQATASSTPPITPLPDNAPPIQSLSPLEPRKATSGLPYLPVENARTPDARFELLAGAHPSTLSIALAASQPLYTRRGTLIGASGPVENAISTLSILSPFVRAVVGVPFLYQRIVSTAPITLMLGAKRGDSGFVIVHLDGRVDWRVVQRSGLVAWCGRHLEVQVGVDSSLALAHWGHSTITGRGMIALQGCGQIFEIRIASGEEYLVHPSNVLAYTIGPHPPQPFRFKSTSGRLQIPSFGSLLPDTKFFRVMRETATFKAVGRVLFTLRTWSRKTIWGDRLFLRFHGPTTILLQSQGSSLRDSLTSRNVNEIADAPAGAVPAALTLKTRRTEEEVKENSSITNAKPRAAPESTLTYAKVAQDGKVSFGSS